MLILTRKVGQAIYVGETRIEVLEIRGTRVKLGVATPTREAVLRDTIFERILAEGIQAGKTYEQVKQEWDRFRAGPEGE